MITDYTSLQTAIADWLARADLTAQIPTFIQLAEQRFARELRVREMQATAAGTLDSSKLINLPTDCREVQSLRVTYSGLPYEIHPLTPAALMNDTVQGFPLGYVVIGNQLKVINGTPGQVYAMTYWQEIPDLASAPMNRNWLIQREPGLYLYASLVEASPYLKDNEQAQVWEMQVQNIMRGMKIADDRARYGNAPSIRAHGP